MSFTPSDQELRAQLVIRTDREPQPVYIGVPVTHGYSKRRRRKHRSQREHEKHHAHRDSGSSITSSMASRWTLPGSHTVSPAAERLRYILSEDDDVPTPTLFTEMDTLQHDGDEMEWKESARWVKFEEKVEEGGERWSKPHVSTLTLHSLFELRTCIQTGSVLLDLEGYSLPQIVDDIVDRQVADGLIGPELREKVSFVLLRKHRHQHKKPIHRSLADMGKSNTSPTSRSPQSVHNVSRNPALSQSMNDISDKPSTDQMKNKFMKKIPRDAEASNVLIGEVDFLDKPFVAFVRLAQATTLGGLTEVPVPTRFLFVLLGPHGKGKSYNEIGRAIATLMVDDLFSDVAYKARDRDDLIAGIDEFLDEVIVLPPGEWDPKIRIEPPKKVPSADMRKSVLNLNELGQVNGTAGGAGGGEDEVMPAPHELGEELQFTGRFCGGLWLDIKRKVPWILSDFSQGFHIQSISAGVMESFLGTALAGTVFCLLGGQPLIILSSTGPILIFEKLLYEFCKSNTIDYMELRLWIGLHSCLQCLILVATDASYIIKYITRFTEEGFSSLISFIFISDAIKKMVGSFKYYPINRGFKPDYVTTYRCECIAPDQAAAMGFNVSVPLADDNMTDLYNITGLDWSQLSKKECVKYGGALLGNSCKYVPDLALISFILFFGTYSMTVSLKKFKTSRYFPTKCRSLIGDFSIIISILVFCGIDYLLGLDTPKLHVPTEIKLRKLISDFSIFMSIMTFVGLDMLVGLDTPKLIVPTEFKNPWWVYVASAVPALLVTILIFMDQQISAVIVNRKENKLKKGCGYHLDLFWVGILMAVCSFLGLPWYVAATVISIAHIDSLKMESESSAPGEQPQFLGVREQRLTGILVFVLTGVSIFLAPVLQPDFSFLRHVPLRRVHLFTLVQIICLAVLWILKSTILGLMVVRKMMDLMFSQHDLAWLDDILPEKDKKKEKGGMKKKDNKRTKAAEPESDEEPKSPLPPPVKIPMDNIDPPSAPDPSVSPPTQPLNHFAPEDLLSPSPAESHVSLTHGSSTRPPVPPFAIQVESEETVLYPRVHDLYPRINLCPPNG
ncbi:unnamed protein product, partial [Coregonus sp. 'balchen']